MLRISLDPQELALLAQCIECPSWNNITKQTLVSHLEDGRYRVKNWTSIQRFWNQTFFTECWLLPRKYFFAIFATSDPKRLRVLNFFVVFFCFREGAISFLFFYSVFVCFRCCEIDAEKFERCSSQIAKRLQDVYRWIPHLSIRRTSKHFSLSEFSIQQTQNATGVLA